MKAQNYPLKSLLRCLTRLTLELLSQIDYNLCKRLQLIFLSKKTEEEEEEEEKEKERPIHFYLLDA